VVHAGDVDLAAGGDPRHEGGRFALVEDVASLPEQAQTRAKEHRRTAYDRKVDAHAVVEVDVEIPLDGARRGLGANRATVDSFDALAQVGFQSRVPRLMEGKGAQFLEIGIHRRIDGAQAAVGGAHGLEHFLFGVGATIDQDGCPHPSRSNRGQVNTQRRPKGVSDDDEGGPVPDIGQGQEIACVVGKAVAFLRLVAVAAAAQVDRHQAILGRQALRQAVEGPLVTGKARQAQQRAFLARPLPIGQAYVIELDASITAHSQDKTSASRRELSRPSGSQPRAA
jgi:hypothetical protein